MYVYVNVHASTYVFGGPRSKSLSRSGGNREVSRGSVGQPRANGSLQAKKSEGVTSGGPLASSAAAKAELRSPVLLLLPLLWLMRVIAARFDLRFDLRARPRRGSEA